MHEDGDAETGRIRIGEREEEMQRHLGKGNPNAEVYKVGSCVRRRHHKLPNSFIFLVTISDKLNITRNRFLAVM